MFGNSSLKPQNMSTDYSYQETVEYLYALQKHGVKLGLANSIALMQVMGDPHKRIPSVHIAGTNGKGSTSAFAAKMLAAAGYRVGLYTSPHLVSFTERIRINGVPITEAKVVELTRRVRSGYEHLRIENEPLNPTFFEVTTAVAFTYFAEEGVDIAVIETGMGGRLDSTNVITPFVSVITNIDLEHTEFLGNTLELIAEEKAGIIKQGVPVVTGVVQPEVMKVINLHAENKQASVYQLGDHFKSGNVSTRQDGQQFDYHGTISDFGQLIISLRGRYQIDNACLALAAIDCLRPAGFSVEEGALRAGLREASWEGRLERVFQKPDIYLDGAHNPASAKNLANALLELKPGYRRVVLIIGILGDKDFRGIISELVPLADVVFVTRPDYSRAMDLSLLSAEIRAKHPAVETAETVGLAIEKAKEKAGPDDLILVTGSLYVVGDARAIILGQAGQSQSFSRLKG